MVEKDKTMDWINSWKKGNKKEIYDITVRFGRLTVLQLYCNPGKEHRCIIFNFGFTI